MPHPRPPWTASTGRGSCCTSRGFHPWGADSGKAVQRAFGGRNTAAEMGRAQISLAQSSVRLCPPRHAFGVLLQEAAYGYDRRLEQEGRQRGSLLWLTHLYCMQRIYFDLWSPINAHPIGA